uniref:Uncharacterized protein n=1 Tax=Trypanosoma congolense (strain IL3000) TaxID=1068625 RepID=G0UR51_TRYCI|nr:hypothetical protein, unlikely [Trypanosoma congolense IL3000]
MVLCVFVIVCHHLYCCYLLKFATCVVLGGLLGAVSLLPFNLFFFISENELQRNEANKNSSSWTCGGGGEKEKRRKKSRRWAFLSSLSDAIKIKQFFFYHTFYVSVAC